MMIILQYTLTDVRKFDSTFTLLKLPQWPLPNPYKEFVRGNGQIVPSVDKTISAHFGKTSIAETYICKINKGVRIPKKLPNSEIRNRINHYFSDGGVLSKYEFVFEFRELSLSYTYAGIKAVISQILNTEISIRNVDFKYSIYKFKNIFRGLIDLQLISTTEKKYISKHFYKYIIKCTPQVFITLDKSESLVYKPRIRIPVTVNDSHQSSLYSWWEKYNNNPYKLWVLKNNGTSKNETLNTLKTGILRIHSEKECINNVIQALLLGMLKTPPYTKESDSLQYFLNEKIKDIGLDYRRISNLDNSEDRIENFIKEAYDIFNPGEVTLLSERLRQLKFRPQVGDKLIKHIINNATYIEKQIIMDNSQSISFGDNAQVTGNIHQEIKASENELDFKSIYESINNLLEKIQSEKETYEKALAVEHLNNAKSAAVRQDSKGVIENFKKAGQWTLDFASKIGINLLTEIIKKDIKS